MEKIGKHNYEAFMLDYMEGNLNEAGISALFAFFEQNPDLKPDFSEDNNFVKLDAEHISFPEKSGLKRSKEEYAAAKEEKIIEYLEGQLSESQKIAFEKELVESPSLLLLFNEYQKTILSPGETSFSAKNNLKRTLIPEETLIAYSEGILSFTERSQLEKELEQDFVAQEVVNGYKRTKLTADTSIVYEDKASLKKRGGLIVYLNEYGKPLAVAASVILLFGLFWLTRGSGTVESGSLEETLASNKKDLDSSSGIKPANADSTNHRSLPAINTMFNTNLFANDKVTINKQKDPSQSIIQKDGLDPVQQAPVAINQENNINKNVIDTFSAQSNALAMVNLDKSKYLFNHYEENDEEAANERDNSITKKEYVAKKITEAAWGEENEPVQKVEEKKLRGFDVLALIGKGLKKLGNKNSDAKKIESEDGKGSDYVVTIGGVSVTRHRTN